VSREERARVALTGLGVPESLRWRDGALFFSDMAAGSVHRWDGRSAETDLVAEIPGRPGGLGWLPDGRMLAVSMDGGCVYRQERDGTLVVHADIGHLTRGCVNDMIVDDEGRAYVGSYGLDWFAYVAEHPASSLLAPPGPPRIGLVRLAADGTILGQTEEIAFPNGAVLLDDGRTLVIAETLTMRLLEFAVDDDGDLHGRGAWAQLIPDALWRAVTAEGWRGRIARGVSTLTDRPAIAERSASPIGPDGIAIGKGGTIWVANALRGECVEVERGGRIRRRIRTSQPALSCVLGGDAGDTLFVATSRHSEPGAARAERTGSIEVFALG